MSEQSGPPLHVRATFGVRDTDAVAHGSHWRCDDVILTHVGRDHERARWSATVRETLDVEGVRVARPIRSTDGRWVVAGWTADTRVVGVPEARHDEVVAMATRLHEATAALPRPALLGTEAALARTDQAGVADRVAWSPELDEFVRGLGSDTATAMPSVSVFRQVARARQKVSAPPQVIDAELYGNVLFAGSAAPGITDITPFWRPAAYGAAVAVVDAVAWGSADDGLVQRWEQHEEWTQLVLHAVLFRLVEQTLHTDTTPEAYRGLVHVAELVRDRV